MDGVARREFPDHLIFLGWEEGAGGGTRRGFPNHLIFLGWEEWG